MIRFQQSTDEQASVFNTFISDIHYCPAYVE